MIYIKDMEMPVDCLACRISCKHESYLVTGRPKDCPLEEAKTGGLISRADAIEAVRKELVCDGRHETHDKTCRFIADVLLSALPSAEAVSRKAKCCPIAETCMSIDCPVSSEYIGRPSAEAVQGEWIPCSERLPDVDVEVLATVDWLDVQIAWLKKGGAWETEVYILDSDEILAWMPLPTPYKGGEDE